MDAAQDRDMVKVDITGAFMQANMECDEV